jgi:hypothetical protein
MKRRIKRDSPEFIGAASVAEPTIEEETPAAADDPMEGKYYDSREGVYYDDQEQYEEQYYRGPAPYASSSGSLALTAFLLWLLWLPIRLPSSLLGLASSALSSIWNMVTFLLGNLHWVVAVGTILLASQIWVANYQPIMENAEYYYRCTLWVIWDQLVGPFFDMFATVWEEFACWWNAMGLIGRLLSRTTLWKLLLHCDNDFTLWTASVKMARTVFQGIISILIWIGAVQPLTTSVAVYPFTHMLFNDTIPYLELGVECACKDLGVVTRWTSNIIDSEDLACIGHQAGNIQVASVQVPVNFFISFLRTILNFLIVGGTPADVTDNYENLGGANDTTLFYLSGSGTRERLGALAVYAGRFTNAFFLKTYCHFTAEVDVMGDENLVQPLYLACIANTTLHKNLFCAIGPIVSGFGRLEMLATKLLIGLPTIIKQTLILPPGPRYMIDTLWRGYTPFFFDTLVNPGPVRNYTLSANFPTLAVLNTTNPPPPSIRWPGNTLLYGTIQNGSCYNYNNSNQQIPCAECGLVEDYSMEECLNITGPDLDSITAPYIGFDIWTPALSCLVPALLRGVVASSNFLSGFVVHIFNIDRMLIFLADQNLYDDFWDAVGGDPYTFGGALYCVELAVVEFDPRLFCMMELFLKPAKSFAEGMRFLTTGVCRFINTIANTGEVGLGSYLCKSGPNCVELERALKWLRRPRLNPGYNPLFPFQPVDPLLPPAFADCLCWVFDFEFLGLFISPPPDVPDICCVPMYLFRWFIENQKLLIGFLLALSETIMSLFDPTAPLVFATTEYAACIDYYLCTNVGDITSDMEDLLVCPCVFVRDLQDLINPGGNDFPCICNIISAGTQFIANLERATALLISCVYDLLYCLENGYPTPHCDQYLFIRYTQGFTYMDTAYEAFAGLIGGFGCILGLPWVIIEIDCVGTRYTWPFDYVDCNTSPHGFGICTMSDRFQADFTYLGKFFVVATKYLYQQIQLVLDLAFTVVSGVTPLDFVGRNTMAEAITNFIIVVSGPVWGISNQLLTYDFDNTTTIPWPNLTGVNLTYLNMTLGLSFNVTFGGFVNYSVPPTAEVYGSTFNYSTIPGLNETTGAVQAAGLTLNCLLGPPTTECIGPLLFGPSTLDGTTGCLGDISVAAGNGFRDVFSIIAKFIGDGFGVIYALFLDSNNFANAVSQFVRDFFQVILVILGSLQKLVDAAIAVIIGVTKFVLGDGVAEMFNFFLQFISQVIGIFIKVITALLGPFAQGKRSIPDYWRFDPDEGAFKRLSYFYEFDKRNEELFKFGAYDVRMPYVQEIVSSSWDKMKKSGMFGEVWESTGERLSRAWNTGYDSFFVTKSEHKEWNMESLTRKKRQAEPSETGSYAMLWKRQYSEQFTKDDAKGMTDSLCKRAMVEWTPENGNTDLYSLHRTEEAVWRACFTAYALPEEIRAATGGQLILPRDFFYNSDTFFNGLKDMMGLFSDYLGWQSQQGAFVPVSVNPALYPGGVNSPANSFNYTEIVNLPDILVELIEIQIRILNDTIHGNEFGQNLYDAIKNDSSAVMDLVGADSTSGNVEITFPYPPAPPPSEDDDGTAEDDETEKKRQNVADVPSTSAQYLKWLTFSTLSKEENVCTPSELADGSNVMGCLDPHYPYPGFVIDLNSTDYTYWRNSEGSMGTSYEPTKLALSIFNDTRIEIYTDLAGKAYIYILKYNQSYPVIDGRIAFTMANLTFSGYTTSKYENSSLINFLTSQMKSSSVGYNNDIYLNFASLGVNTSGNTNDALASDYVQPGTGKLTLEQLQAIIQYYNDSWTRMKANRSTSHPTRLRPPPPPAPLSPSAKRFLEKRRLQEEALAKEGKIVGYGNGRPTMNGWAQGFEKITSAFREGFHGARRGDLPPMEKMKLIYYPKNHKIRRKSMENFIKHNENLYEAWLAKKILNPDPESDRLLWTSTTHSGKVGFPFVQPQIEDGDGDDEWYFTETPTRKRDVVLSSKKRGMSYSLGDASETHQSNLAAKVLMDNLSMHKPSFSLKNYLTETLPKSWTHYTNVNHDSKNVYNDLMKKIVEGALEAGKYAMKPHHDDDDEVKAKVASVKCAWNSDGTRVVLEKRELIRSEKDYFVLHGGFKMQKGLLYPSINAEQNVTRLFQILHVDPSLQNSLWGDETDPRYHLDFMGSGRHLMSKSFFGQNGEKEEEEDGFYRKESVLKLGFEKYEYHYGSFKGLDHCKNQVFWHENVLVSKLVATETDESKDAYPRTMNLVAGFLNEKKGKNYFFLRYDAACDDPNHSRDMSSSKTASLAKKAFLSYWNKILFGGDFEKYRRGMVRPEYFTAQDRKSFFFSTFKSDLTNSEHKKAEIFTDRHFFETFLFKPPVENDLTFTDHLEGGAGPGEIHFQLEIVGKDTGERFFFNLRYEATTFWVAKCAPLESDLNNGTRIDPAYDENGYNKATGNPGTFYSLFRNVTGKLGERLYWPTIRAKISERLLDGYVEKMRETYARGSIPTINRFFLSISEWDFDFGAGWTAFAGSFWRGSYIDYMKYTGHPTEATGYGGGGEDDYNYYYEGGGETMKRGQFSNDTLINLCIPPRPGTPNITTCARCVGCITQSCSSCSNCSSCVFGTGGFYDCDVCSDCNFNGPACQGECFECTGCSTGTPCLDCKLVQYVLTKMQDYVIFCYQLNILNNTLVIRLPASTFFNTSVWSNYTVVWPNISDYGWSNWPQYFFTVFINLVDVIFTDTANVLALFTELFTNANLDPFQGPVGFQSIAYTLFFQGCNRDLNLMGTFGLGFNTGFLTGTLFILILKLGLWFVCPQLAGLLGSALDYFVSGTLWMVWLIVCLYLAYYWNPRCGVTAGEGLTDVMGLRIFPTFMVPEPFIPDLNNFLVGFLTRCRAMIPADFTTNNVSCPATCDPRLDSSFTSVIDCEELGFKNGAFDALAYLGQRWLPEPARFWLVTYLNKTGLSFPGTGLAGVSNIPGPLAPFFATNFSEVIANNQSAADKCFEYVAVFNLPLFFSVLGLAFYIIYSLGSFGFNYFGNWWNSILESPIFLFFFPYFGPNAPRAYRPGVPRTSKTKASRYRNRKTKSSVG